MRSASTQPGCGLGHSPAPFSLSSSLHLSILFLHPAPTSPQPAVPACQPPRAAKQLLQLSLSSCSASPFLLHKITEAARYGIRRVALYSTCRPSLPVQLADCGAQFAAPLPLHQIRWPRLLSGSHGILSVAGGAIGKQRPKMRFPVSFPSLLNK